MPSADSTLPPHPPIAAVPAQRVIDPGAGGDAYFALAIGGIVLLMYPRFLKWLSSKILGTTFMPYMLNGQEVPYTQTADFPSDLAVTAFGLALVVEGLVLLLASRSKALLLLAAGAVGLATGGNLVYLAMTFSTSGLAIVSLVAVVYGIWTTRTLLMRAQLAGDTRGS